MTSQMTLDDICRGVTKQVRLARPMVSPPTSRTCGLIRVVRGLEGAFVVWETTYASDLQPLLTDDRIGGGNPTEASLLKAGIRCKPVHLRWCRSAFQPRFGKPSCQVISSYHYLTSHSADLPVLPYYQNPRHLGLRVPWTLYNSTSVDASEDWRVRCDRTQERALAMPATDDVRTDDLLAQFSSRRQGKEHCFL